MNKTKILITMRLFFGLLVLTAIGVQLYRHIHFGFDVVNFFSYFTNLSNIFAGLVLLLGAAQLARNKKPTVLQNVLRGSSVVAMAIVGIVFSLLLRDVDLGTLLPWVNIVLHYIMPVFILFEWFYSPPSMKITIKQITYWMIFPLLYLAYTIIRGASIDWYPYPFLNPDEGGYTNVALYAIGITVLFFILSVVLARAVRLERN